MIHRPQTWLITGASGFLGRALVDLLQLRPNQKRILISRKQIPHRANTLQIHADLNEFTALNSIINQHRPDIVLNLAGRTPPASDTDLWNDNAELTFNLLNCLKSCQYPVRLVHAGSAAELGEVPLEKLPVDESYKPDPVTTYGKSKWAASEAVLQASGGPITPMVARIFNLIGPGQSTHQAFGRYAAELAATEIGKPLQIKAFGLTHRRDFIDVRDAASAILALADHGKTNQVYHVGTGVSRSLLEGLEILARNSGRNVEWIESLNHSAQGPSDSKASIKLIQMDTHWCPQVSFEQSLTDLWTGIVSTTP